METIYVDALFFLNLLTDYLLCLLSARLCGLYLKRKRYLLAALLGALYALLTVLPGFAFLASPLGKLAAGLGMGVIAFSEEEKPLRCILCLFAVCACFGGLLYALQLGGGGARISLRLLITAFLFCYGVLRLLSRFRSRHSDAQTAEVRLLLNGRESCFHALRDSGNSLRDPDSGAGVLVVSPRVLRPLFAQYAVLFEQLPAVDLLEAAAQVPELRGKLRLIPYRALGGAGLLPVFRPDGLWIDGKENRELLAAVSVAASGDGFEAIL